MDVKTSVQTSIPTSMEFLQSSKSIFTQDILPIFDNLSQIYLPFQTFELVQILFCIFQLFETSFWGSNGDYWKGSKLTNYFHYFSFFSSIHQNPKEHLIIFGILFSVVLIISILSIFLFIHYRKTRRINKPILYIVRLYHLFFGGVILHPLSSLTGHSFSFVIDYHKKQDIFILVLSFITFVLAELLFYFNQCFVNQSIYIHKSLWSTFDSTFLIFFFVWNPIFLLFSHMFKYYPTWSFYALIILHIFIILISIIDYVWVPFIYGIGDLLSIAIICSIIFNDILRIVAEKLKIKQGIFIAICFSIFLLFIIVFHIIIKNIIKKINLKLSYSYLANINNNDQTSPIETKLEEKYNYFTTLNLEQNMTKAKIYLIVGFKSGSDLFVDFSLVQFCIEKYKDSPKMMILLVQLLSYFKSEKNRFDIVLKQFHSFHDTSIYSQFIYNQAYRVKLFRQSTSTDLSSSQLIELKTQSNDLENQIKSFWALPSASTMTLDLLEQQKRNLINLWDESIDENWSSISFREEQIHFLIESCTDFQKAVRMTNLKDKIDILNRKRDDLCFLSLLTCFPCYFNNKILDFEGNLLIKKSCMNHSNQSSAISSNSRNEKLSTSSNEYDFTFEEQIANTIITSGRLRLEMQNALNHVKPTMNKVLIIYALISIIGSYILIIATFASYFNSFDKYDNWSFEIGGLVDLRIAYNKAFLCLTIFFGQKIKRFHLDHFDCNLTDASNQAFLDPSTQFNELALHYVEESKEKFSTLMDTILQLGIKRVDISALSSLFYDSTIDATFCYEGIISNNFFWSMEKTLNFHLYSFTVLANDENIFTWYTNNTYWCHDVVTAPSVSTVFTDIQNSLSDELFYSSNRMIDRISNIMYIVGPLDFFLFVIPLPIIIFYYCREINQLIKMMLSTDQVFKEQARRNISINNDNHDLVAPIAKKSLNWKFFLYPFLLILIFLSFVCCEELILYYTIHTSKMLCNYGYMFGYFSLLRSYLLEILNELMNAVFYAIYPQNKITNESFKNRVRQVLRDFELDFYDVMNDTPKTPSSLGKDSLIDFLISSSYCEAPYLLTKIHDVYECASLNRLISTIHSLIEKATEEYVDYNGIFANELLSNIYHVIFVHAKPIVHQICNRFILLQMDETGSFKTKLIIFLVIGIICVIIWSLLLYLIYVNFKRIFDMALTLIRRLSPVGLISNVELTNYLMYKRREEVEFGLTHKIFNNSFDGIICLNIEGIVEIINKSFSNNYGYSIEQLVGQMIGNIFDNESRTKLENQLKLMKNHESNNYSDHVTCFTNDGRAVPSYVSLFVQKEKENSLILVIRDETILLHKKKSLELAKKQSQDLLEQIMPPKVLMMLKEGQSEISFSVPSASVMFVNIVNFSGFSAPLSPQQIMGTLSTLFGAFDVWIQKFSLMTKIKLIGDSYMAACGLFAVDQLPKEHAKQCIDFALRVLNILDDTNIKLNVNLEIRIGVNSDGPIIAGVLGTENRVFDIIGDTINVASRLEHKAEPGHIMMSEKTYELVKDVGYNIIPKGEVFLKGKGDMPAYSI